MKKIYLLFFPIVLLALSSCYRTIDKMGNTANNIILSYPAATDYNVAASGINYWNRALLNLDLGKASQDVAVSINLAQAISEDVSVTLGVDQTAIAAYNKDTIFGSTKYTAMPAAYYQLPAAPIKLLKGTTDTTINIKFFPSKFDISATGYLLPVTITTATGANISNMKTIYFHIEKDPMPPFGRSAWKVIEVDSEEPAEGQWGNGGLAIHAFDGNANTFWHSQWSGATPPLPHWFAVDMGSAQVIHGYIITQRAGDVGGRCKDVTISVSNDGKSWTTLSNLILPDNSTVQKALFNASSASVRYFKFTVNSTYYDKPFCHLAEINFY